jgi:hypothetical protein
MVSGFLGMLISLERAVALELRWTYIGPALSGLGAILLLAGDSISVGPALLTAGSVGLTVTFYTIVRQQPALYTFTMAGGALCWLVGNGLWLVGQPMHRVVLWWMGFLLLTIVGERLELSRLLRLPQRRYAAFVAATGIFLAGLIISLVDLDLGTHVIGAGLVATTLWLLWHDIARRTIRQSGLRRFIAVCLLSGYVWLGTSGLLALRFGGLVAGPHYDAMLHAFFLGFVFAMIFGHAPIILPAVMGWQITFSSTFYLHLAFLHVSLMLRIVSDLLLWRTGRLWGGLLNVIVLLLFLASTAYTVRASAGAKKARSIS